MRESKLTEMVKGISPAEFKKFGEFLNSPYHNKSRKIIQLYELINFSYDEFDANIITNEKIAKAIFSGEGDTQGLRQKRSQRHVGVSRGDIGVECRVSQESQGYIGCVACAEDCDDEAALSLQPFLGQGVKIDQGELPFARLSY